MALTKRVKVSGGDSAEIAPPETIVEPTTAAADEQELDAPSLADTIRAQVEAGQTTPVTEETLDEADRAADNGELVPTPRMREIAQEYRSKVAEIGETVIPTPIVDSIIFEREPAPITRFVEAEVIEPEDTVQGFLNLEAAEAGLSSLLGAEEHLRVKAARLIQNIRDRELFREKDFTSFRAYLPTLLERTAAIGWGSERTIKSYLQFVEVYLDALGLPQDEAIKAVSHLQLLSKLAQFDGETVLDEPTKPGKLPGTEFESVVETIVFMVNHPQAKAGVEQGTLTAEMMQNVNFHDVVADWNKLTGTYPSIPAGGWTIRDTKALIALLAPKEEAEEEAEEEAPKARRVWTLGPNLTDDSSRVYVERVTFFYGDKELYEIAIEEDMAEEKFKMMTAGDELSGGGTRESDEDTDA